MRELCTYVDLHLELVARELYPQAFFGGSVSEATQARVRKQLTKNIAALQAPGEVLALPGWRHLHAGRLLRLCQPAAGRFGHRIVFGEDLLAAQPASTGRAYVKMVGARARQRKRWTLTARPIRSAYARAAAAR